MQSRILFLSGWTILTISIIFAVVLSNSSPALSSTQTTLEECQSLNYNGENAINLLFFGTKEQSIEYSKFLMSTKPLNENSQKFNTYFIDSKNYQVDCGELYKNIAILCYSKELIKKSASCPNIDFIFVLQKENRKIRSSAYLNVGSINSNSQVSKTVIQHEFGHLFANLAEEYTPANIPRGSENCQRTCEGFNGIENECVQGCSDGNHIRSIKNGVMRTLASSDFGTFNDQLIKQEIEKMSSSKITGFVAKTDNPDCKNEKYILVEGKYNSGEIKILNKSIQQGCVGTNGKGPFKYEISTGERKISGGDFNPTIMFTDAQDVNDQQINGETFSDLEKPFFLTLPISSTNKKLRITDENNNFLTEISLEDAGARPCRV